MFEFVRNNSGQNYPVIEQRPAKASTTYEPGMLLDLVGGVLTPATTGNYICVRRRGNFGISDSSRYAVENNLCSSGKFREGRRQSYGSYRLFPDHSHYHFRRLPDS